MPPSVVASQVPDVKAIANSNPPFVLAGAGILEVCLGDREEKFRNWDVLYHHLYTVKNRLRAGGG